MMMSSLLMSRETAYFMIKVVESGLLILLPGISRLRDENVKNMRYL